MINSFCPPHYGDIIPLLYLKCKKMFTGPNPRGPRLFDGNIRKLRKARCPKCGSRRIIPYPWIHW